MDPSKPEPSNRTGPTAARAGSGGTLHLGSRTLFGVVGGATAVGVVADGVPVHGG